MANKKKVMQQRCTQIICRLRRTASSSVYSMFMISLLQWHLINISHFSAHIFLCQLDLACQPTAARIVIQRPELYSMLKTRDPLWLVESLQNYIYHSESCFCRQDANRLHSQQSKRPNMTAAVTTAVHKLDLTTDDLVFRARVLYWSSLLMETACWDLSIWPSHIIACSLSRDNRLPLTRPSLARLPRRCRIRVAVPCASVRLATRV